MHLWVVLPEDLSSLDLHRTAIAHGLGFAPGPLFFPDGRGTNCLRLNFSTHEPQRDPRGHRAPGRPDARPSQRLHLKELP